VSALRWVLEGRDRWPSVGALNLPSSEEEREGRRGRRSARNGLLGSASAWAPSSPRDSDTGTRMASLPIIDISPFLPNAPKDTLAQQSTAQQLHIACRDYGFFYLALPPSFVSSSDTDKLTSLANKFFEQPQTEKDKISLRHSDGARGAGLYSPYLAYTQSRFRLRPPQ
jgi:hypothetical protein